MHQERVVKREEPKVDCFTANHVCVHHFAFVKKYGPENNSAIFMKKTPPSMIWNNWNYEQSWALKTAYLKLLAYLAITPTLLITHCLFILIFRWFGGWLLFRVRRNPLIHKRHKIVHLLLRVYCQSSKAGKHIGKCVLNHDYSLLESINLPIPEAELLLLSTLCCYLLSLRTTDEQYIAMSIYYSYTNTLELESIKRSHSRALWSRKRR